MQPKTKEAHKVDAWAYYEDNMNTEIYIGRNEVPMAVKGQVKRDLILLLVRSEMGFLKIPSSGSHSMCDAQAALRARVQRHASLKSYGNLNRP